VLAQGVKKVSVDDITKAAGVAKGTFYHHFESKEAFLNELIWDFHRQIFSQAEQMILNASDIKEDALSFFLGLFQVPELIFFIQNERDITEVLLSVPDSELKSAKLLEQSMFEDLLKLAGFDTEKVKPGVVHNYIHALFLIKGSDLMMEDALPETLERIMQSLVAYLFEGEES
jgi:AcrR family transcriptional regulator